MKHSRTLLKEALEQAIAVHEFVVLVLGFGALLLFLTGLLCESLRAEALCSGIPFCLVAAVTTARLIRFKRKLADLETDP